MNDLLATFGLKRYPFDKDIKSSQAVETTSLAECTARLDYMKRRQGIMLLTGDPGVGKSIALRRFVDSLNDNLYRPLYTPLSTLKGTDLLRHINALLGLPNRASKAVVYRQIQREILDSREQRGKTVVIIIDEAQLLQVGPLQELRLLTNFKMDSADPFILILAGQSEMRRTMDFAVMEPLAQRLTMRFHMPALGRDEVHKYVEGQMKLAGAHEPIFDDSAIDALHELGHGIPRRIGTIAVQALTCAMFAHERTINADTIMTVKQGG